MQTRSLPAFLAPLALVACAALATATPYSDVDATDAANLRTTLHDAIDDHTRIKYTSSTQVDVWDVIETADEDPNNSSRVLDIYLNASYPKYTAGNAFYDREHAWPKSYGFPKDVVANYPYTDCHHLFIANGNYNSSRNNKPYDFGFSTDAEKTTLFNDGRGGGVGIYPGNSNWTNGSGQGRWETWIGRRGDVARALLYMDVRYEGDTHGVTGVSEPDLILTDNMSLLVSDSKINKTVGYMGRLSTLLEWHRQDPVDPNERNRNDVVESFQGNRNPFIDHPEWVDCVFNDVCDVAWINEFHYDNAGSDKGEFVEITARAGTDVSGWTVVGYNGANGQVYKTATLTGTVPDEGDCRGTFSVSFSGMQNGPDALALVNADGDVLHFIAYEGDVTATGGDANGMTALDIGVSESGSTPVGHSLQLTGIGGTQHDFDWQTAAVDSPASLNTSQLLQDSCDGSASSGGSGSGGSLSAWINEFHYDDSGADQGEFVEIAGSAGLSLSGWKILFYNGSNSLVYKTVNITGTIDNESGNAGALSYSISGIQNGPDAIALVDNSGTVVDFIAYESTFTAGNGAAAGTTPTLISASESPSTPAGRSLQRTDDPCSGGTGTWTGPNTDSPGDLNSGQSVSCP